MISTIWFYLHSIRTHLALCELISCTGKYLHKRTSAVLMIVDINISHSFSSLTKPGSSLPSSIQTTNVKFELKIFVYSRRMSKLEDNIASGIAMKCRGDDDDEFKIFSIGTNRRGWWTGFNAFLFLFVCKCGGVLLNLFSVDFKSNAYTHTDSKQSAMAYGLMRQRLCLCPVDWLTECKMRNLFQIIIGHWMCGTG